MHERPPWVNSCPLHWRSQLLQLGVFVGEVHSIWVNQRERDTDAGHLPVFSNDTQHVAPIEMNCPEKGAFLLETSGPKHHVSSGMVHIATRPVFHPHVGFGMSSKLSNTLCLMHGFFLPGPFNHPIQFKIWMKVSQISFIFCWTQRVFSHPHVVTNDGTVSPMLRKPTWSRFTAEVSSAIFQWSGWWFLASWILSCFFWSSAFFGIQCVVS